MTNQRHRKRIGRAWAVMAIGVLAAGTAGAAVPAFAQTKTGTTLTQAQALAIVRRDFAIPASFHLNQESYNNQQNNGPANYWFAFTYTSPTGQQQNINASIDATSGMALSYYTSSSPYPQSRFTFPPKESLAAAQQTAVAWAKKLYPSEYPQTRLQPTVDSQGALTQPISYTFNFERFVQNIPAPFDGISITIDQNGTVQSVNASWTANQTFPAPSLAISPTAAALAYGRNLGVHEAYTTVWQTVTSQVYLAYVQPQNYPNFWNNQFDGTSDTIGAPVLNAQNGEPVNALGQSQSPVAYHSPRPLTTGGPAVDPFTSKVNWSEAQSLDYAKQIVGVTPSYHLTGTSQMLSQPGGDNQWTFNWSAPNHSTVSATVDATFGALVSYNSYTPFKPGTSPLQQKFGQPATITQAQSTAAATAFLRKTFPHDTGGLALTPQSFQGYGTTKVDTNFSITPLLHGLPFQGEGGSIEINGQTGKVQNFWWQPTMTKIAALPLPSQALSLSQATRDWVQARPLRLEYLLTQPQAAAKFAAASGKPVSVGAPRVILAYAPLYSPYQSVFNAVTGHFQVSPANQKPYSGTIHGLSGVAQAPQITLLVRHGLLPVGTGGSIQPQQNMTRAAFVSLLANALGLNNGNAPITAAMQHSLADVASASPAYQPIRSAYANGWLPGGQLFHPNQLITRSQAADVLAHALGYGALLSHSDMFHLSASDASTVPSSDYAAAALASSLGLLPLQQGDFHPAGPVTLAQAANAVVAAATYYTPPSGFCMGCGGPAG